MASSRSARLIFLPGASGNTRLFCGAADALHTPCRRVFVGYPGFGGRPADPAVGGLDDLLTHVLAELHEPAHLVAQSMGGVLALRAALARPEQVLSLVLTGTSGGIDVRALGGSAWQHSFAQAFPSVPDWFMRDRTDLTDRLAEVRCEVQLVWGTADPISPVAVGERLYALLPNARLALIEGGDHDFPATHARELASLIDAHLARWS